VPANNKPKFIYNFTVQRITVVMCLMLLATLLSFLVEHLGFTEVNIVVIYILSVLLASRYTKCLYYGVAASLIATLSFNFFFTEPIYSFTVYDKSYIFTFLVMLLAAIFSSTLTSNLINAEEQAKKKESQAQILYQVTSSLAKASGTNEVLRASMECLASLFNSSVSCIITDEILGSKFHLLELQNIKSVVSITQLNREAFDEHVKRFHTTPVLFQDRVVCYFCLPADILSSDENKYLEESIFMQITIAVERVLLTEEKETAKIETEQERFKSSLLRSVSHDLRTPLSGITGAAEILLHRLKDHENITLVNGIYEDSAWLNRLVENILNLTRLQEGRINIATRQEALEEVISEAVRHVQKYAAGRRILVNIPEEVLFVPMDGKLIVQVLVNLLDNAIRSTEKSGTITVSVTVDHDRVWISVEDDGEGLENVDISKIFDIFYVADKKIADAKRGAGLGLAICKAIVTMHNGEIVAENKKDGGASFRFCLNC